MDGNQKPPATGNDQGLAQPARAPAATPESRAIYDHPSLTEPSAPLAAPAPAAPAAVPTSQQPSPQPQPTAAAAAPAEPAQSDAPSTPEGGFYHADEPQEEEVAAD